MARRAKVFRVAVYNGDFRLADRMASASGGKQSREFAATKEGKRDAALFLLSWMKQNPPIRNNSNPAKVYVELSYPSGDHDSVGKAGERNGEWVWSQRPDWMPA